ncbi:uncharacterized protein LOC141907750 [Tubulanus polymorphus]|uniref:uncharacterized protein LOC141907750 n=1 Tax=Tubulanus polymorphus TaxID=672921 RepID=UPI003DA3710B
MTATNESSNTPQPIERPDDDYYMNDTMDNNLSKMTGEGKCHDMKNLQDHSNTLDPARLEWQQPENIEEDAEGETYIVTIDKDESTESQKNVFLVVGTQFLWEKDLYGQLHEKLDLRSLLSIHPYTANSNCAGFHGQTALRLTFDYCKKSRQERKYIMEDDQDCQKLLTQLQPFIAVRNMESERKDLYHCLKCQRNFPFLKKVTKLVDSKDVNRLCPHCDSSMLIELSGEEIQARAPSGDAIEQVGSLKYCKAVDSSCPLATSSTQNTPVKSRMLGMNHSKSLTESFLSFADSTTISSSYRSLTDTTSDFFTLDESKGCTSETDRLQTYGVPKNQHFYQLTYPSSGASDKSFSKAEDTFLRHEEENVKLMDNQEHLTSEESDITVLSGQDSATMVQKLTLEGVPNIDKTIHSSVNSDCNLPRVSRGGSSDDRKKVLDDCSYGMQLDSLTSGRTASDKTSPMGSLTNRTLNSMVESIYESSISRKHSSESSVFDKVIENQESDIFIVKRVKDKNIAGYTAGNKRSAWYNEDTVPLSTDHDDAYPSHKNPFSDDSETLLDTNEYSSNPFITNDKNPFVETTDDSDQTCLQKCENVCKDVTQESRMYDDNGLTIQNNPFLDEVTDETDCTSSGQLIVTNSLKSDSSVASAAFAEGENPFRSEVLVNMGDCCSIQRLTGVQVETPQNTDTNVVRYNFEDYGQVDHRIMLWLTMKVFNEENEECQALLRCGIVQYMNPDEFQGLLIVSNKKLYIVRIVGEERDNPDNWATCVENQLITEVHYVDVGYGHQSFRLEFGTEGSSYTFIIRDHGRCKKFIHGLTELVRSTTSSQKSKLEGISREYGETVDNIISQIIAPNNEETEVIDVDTGKLKILFISGHWKKANTTELWQPITLIVSHCTIYICHQNYQWPMPRLQALVHAELAKTQFEVKSKQVINEIECLEIYDICPTHVKIVFFNEDGMKDPESWDIAMETEQSRDQLIHALSKPWQDDFGVALSINQSKEIPCNVQTNFSIVAAQPFFGFGK